MSYQRRQRVRDTAMSMANTIGAKYSDLRVTIDMESVDGEDAFVWIEVLRGLRPAELPTFIDRPGAAVRPPYRLLDCAANRQREC